jgi:ribosomal protein S18 acetylase RimI-like enzyme
LKITKIESIRNLERADLCHISNVHCAAFPNSILSALGPGPVRRYYSWLLSDSHRAIALGMGLGGELVGFVFGGIFNSALGGFLKRNYVPLAGSVLLRPWLLTKKQYRRRVAGGARVLLPFLGCRPKRPDSRPWPATKTFGILSIAIRPNYQGLGYGRLLLAECERVAKEQAFAGMTLTVSPGNEAAVEFYRQLGWTKLPTNGRWNGTMCKPLS